MKKNFLDEEQAIMCDKKVSVIIPCYNHGCFVSEAIESALNQTYKNIEVVCVNDASTDNSAEIIQKYADKYNNVIFVNQKTNGGLSHSRNTAIENASGYYILPLDADDKIHPSYVEKAVKIIGNSKIKFKNIKKTGSYNVDKLPDILEKEEIDTILIPTTFPETFSYTTSEAMSMEIPVACFNVGAPCERVKTYQKGLIISKINAQSVLDEIIENFKKTLQINKKMIKSDVI